MKKLNYQNIFCFISILFIISCCSFYGTRFIKLYLENQKDTSQAKNSLAEKIFDKNENTENFKNINDEYYFIGHADNNYLEYSNILWRIIKITENNEIIAISENSLTSLAYGKDTTYKDSYINKWLNSSNEDYTGILENVLSNKDTFLTKTKTCHDQIDTIDNSDCQNTTTDTYLSLLTTSDFANIGKDSYLNNGEYFYLANTNSENYVWYLTNDGKISTGTGQDIIGVRPIITLKSNLKYRDGNGKIDNPYLIEDERSLFGSYVKLDDTLWRIYQVNDTEIRLMLNDYLTIKDQSFTYKYSNTNSYHNDTQTGSLAYYLNNNFLKTLSYKDKIKEVVWSNGYYGSSANYDYTKSLSTTIKSKVALLSIGDINLNSNLSNYYTMTGTSLKGSMVYINTETKKLTTKYITSELPVVPTISLDKELLTNGNGTLDSPYEME